MTRKRKAEGRASFSWKTRSRCESAARPGGDGCGPCRPQRRCRPPGAEGQEKRGRGSHSHCMKWAQPSERDLPAPPTQNHPGTYLCSPPSNAHQAQEDAGVVCLPCLVQGCTHRSVVSPSRTSARPPSAPAPHPTLRTDQEQP